MLQEIGMDSTKLVSIKAEIEVDAGFLEKAKEEIMKYLPAEESQLLTDLEAALNVTLDTMKTPPSSLTDEQTETIEKATGRFSEYLPYIKKFAFILKRVDGSDEYVASATKSINSLNETLKKLTGQGCVSKLFLLCIIRKVMAELDQKLQEFSEVAEKLPPTKEEIEKKVSDYVSEEAQKKMEEKAANMLEGASSEGFFDRMTDALGM